MKFNDGYWELKPGVQRTDAIQIREVKIKDDCVYIYIVGYKEDIRAIGLPVLELFISSPLPDIIRIKSYHHMGSNDNEPQFKIKDNCERLNVTQQGDIITITSGKTSLVIDKAQVLFEYKYEDRLLTRIAKHSGRTSLSTMKTPQGAFMRARLEVDLDEKIYGLGERFTPFVKNGQVVDIWNEDGGTGSEIAYKNVPFYITNKGYGVFVNSTDHVSYEVCSEAVTNVQFSVEGEKLDFMVIGGDDMKGVLKNYTDLTGKPALPPAWSFGLWLTSSFTTSYDEDTVMSFVDGMAERNIPLHVFHFDCFWMKENEWCNFTWDEDMFPDVEGMLGRMKNDKNLKICVWINSYIAQKSPLFLEAKELGYLLKRANGDVWQWDRWQSGMGLVDFTNPGAYKWYQDKLRVLLDQGVDCFKTDFGERIPTDVVYYDGSNPKQMHNYYTQLYNQCVFELLEEYRGKNEACLFARSATAGGQQFPVHWGGDCASSFISMSESIRGGLSLCMSGFGFWSHDISGFEGTAPSSVYKRWAAFGLLSTHSRLHGANSYRVPWLFGDEAVDVVKFFTEFKCSLMPYLYSQAVYTHEVGVPVMRAMVLEYPDDMTCGFLDRQYMLGDSILVAPVFKEDGNVEYYLPKGRWTSILTNEVIDSTGSWYNENHGYMSLPLMAKENTVIALGNENQTPEYDYTSSITLHIYELNSCAGTTVCKVDASKALSVDAQRCGDKVSITFDGNASDVKVVLHNVTEIDNLIGATSQATSVGIQLNVNNELSAVTYQLK